MNIKGKLTILGFVAGGALIIACGSSTPDSTDAGTKDIPIAGSTAAAAPTSKAAADPDAIEGDGTFAVGSQVKPGTYRAVVPADSYGCYYERLKGVSGEFNDILSNENAEAGTQVLVTIKGTDKFFHTERCGTWHLVK